MQREAANQIFLVRFLLCQHEFYDVPWKSLSFNLLVITLLCASELALARS